MLLLAAPIVPGMSGAPVLHPEEGTIQGVVVKKFLEFGIALPVEVMKPVVLSLKEFGRWEPAKLGMSINHSMEISAVEDSSLAARSGFRAKDCIMSVNGARMSLAELLEVVWFDNGPLSVEILRGEEKMFFVLR